MEELYYLLSRWIGGILNVDIKDNKDFHDGVYFMKLIELLTDKYTISQAKEKNFENIQIFLDEKYDINTNQFIDYEQFLIVPEDEQVVNLGLFIVGLLHFLNRVPAQYSQKDMATLENLIKPISEHLSTQVPLTEKALSIRISQFITDDASNSIMYSSEMSNTDMNNSALEQQYEYSENSFTGNYKRKDRKRMLIYNHKTPTRPSRAANKSIMNYKAKVSEYESDILELQYRLDGLQSQLDEKSERINIMTNAKTQLMKEKCDLEDIVKMNDDQIQKMNKSVDRLTNENDHLKVKLNKEKSEYKKLELSVRSLEKENDNFRETTEKLKKMLSQKDAQLEEYKHESHEVNIENGRLQNEMELLKNQNYELNQELKLMNDNRVVNINDSTYSNPYTEVEQGENMVIIFETQVKELTEELSKQRSENISLHKTICEHEHKAELLQQTLSDLKKGTHDINNVLSNFEEVVNRTDDQEDLLYVTNRVKNILQLDSPQNCANCESGNVLTVATNSVSHNNKGLHDICQSELMKYRNELNKLRGFENENTSLLLQVHEQQEIFTKMKVERFELNRIVAQLQSEIEQNRLEREHDSMRINELHSCVDRLTHDRNQLVAICETKQESCEDYSTPVKPTFPTKSNGRRGTSKMQPLMKYLFKRQQESASKSPNKGFDSNKTPNRRLSKSQFKFSNSPRIDQYEESTPIAKDKYRYSNNEATQTQPRVISMVDFSHDDPKFEQDLDDSDSFITLVSLQPPDKPVRRIKREPGYLHKENQPPNDVLYEYPTTGRQIYSPTVYPDRLDTLRDRNVRQPAHLKTSYPVETQSMNTSLGANWVCSRSDIPVSDSEDTPRPPPRKNTMALSPLVMNNKGGGGNFKKPQAFPKSNHEMMKKSDLRQGGGHVNPNVCGFGLTGSDKVVNEFLKANYSPGMLRDTGAEVMSARNSCRKTSDLENTSPLNRSFSAREYKAAESFTMEFSPKKKLGPGSKKKTYDDGNVIRRPKY